jgi:hypothetical protein
MCCSRVDLTVMYACIHNMIDFRTMQYRCIGQWFYSEHNEIINASSTIMMTKRCWTIRVRVRSIGVQQATGYSVTVPLVSECCDVWEQVPALSSPLRLVSHRMPVGIKCCSHTSFFYRPLYKKYYLCTRTLKFPLSLKRVQWNVCGRMLRFLYTRMYANESRRRSCFKCYRQWRNWEKI